jgi:hypothetical protein
MAQRFCYKTSAKQVASCVMVLPQGNMVLHLPMDDCHFGCVIFLGKKTFMLMEARLNFMC